MDAHPHFVAFLDTTVNLKAWKLTQLDDRVQAIVNALQADEVVGPLYKEHIPQGSWAQETIIEPVGAYDEFDADFLLHLTLHDVWGEDEKREYLRKVRAALNATATYKGKVQKKNRCVRVVYKNDCHVDVVPHLTLPDGRQVIVNYADDCFEDTNPAGFSAWMQERDDLTNGNLRKVIRLLKYLRDFKNTFDCKSVILTTLVGGRVQAFDEAARYADIPTTLVTLLEDLNSWLSWHATMPLLHDPSCPGVSFNHRWDEARYQTFKTMISKYATWAREAYDAGDDDLALSAWQKLFGPEFVAPVVVQARKALTASAALRHSAPDVDRAPGEEFIEEKGYRFTPQYAATIDGRIVNMPGFRKPSIRQFPFVPRHRELEFRLKTDCPGPIKVLWKVRNRGQAAADASDLRGEIRTGDSTTLVHRETTKYRGEHYIEVYVIKDGVVVASDHHEVVIR